MPGARLNKKLLLCGFFVATFSVFGWLRLLFLINSYEFRPRRHAPDATRLFSTAVPNHADWYRQHCFGNTKENFTIGKLEDLMEGWHSAQHPGCKELHRIFDDIYQVTRKSGQVVIPDTFQTKVLKWLGNNYDLLKDVKLQFVTTVFNLITHESSVFNPIRSKRPGVATGDRDVASYVDELAKETENDCDFCAYQFKTAEDTFGRIESTHSATAANTFKYDSFHALILLKTHHPTAFSEEQFMDFTSTAMKWFMKCYDTDKQYRYPHLMWDSLPKASASQVHPHAQASLSAARHYGLMEHLHLSAEHYADQHDGDNYFSHLLQIHNALGLTTFLGNASAMAYLTPKKDHEVFIMSRTSGEDFFRLIYYTIRTFIDDLKLPAFSMAMFLPRLEPFSAPTSEDIPAVARIITRGPPDNPRNDISSMELFGASNVNVDPFAVIGHIKNTIHRNKKGVQPSPHVKEDALIDQKKEEAPHVQATQEKSEVNNQNSKDSDNQVQGGAL
ncbi:PREDICTED: uncharacterized protein LOC109472346 [Branchiostoma belcheri]|uniref:Uncharacterized protein LOC109472346 n=1 Tax=Branchiostoma belcheri TaxID=7741 RepID=A0A6P4Z967_BRABE|nr:PREDICTED: uncharacterized protein LOC109472346 [Branchiostoma belcheri]